MVMVMVVASAEPGRQGLARFPEVYPPVVVPILAVPLLAGAAVVVRPALAQVAAVVALVAAVHLAGMCLVAYRDWFNLAGAGGTPFEHAVRASRRAAVGAVAATFAAGLNLGACWSVSGFRSWPTIRDARIARWGLGVLLLVPVLLCGLLGYQSLSAPGQFTAWWSLPWGGGLALAAVLNDAPARRAAWFSVAASMLLTSAWVIAFWLGLLPLRLPD